MHDLTPIAPPSCSSCEIILFRASARTRQAHRHTRRRTRDNAKTEKHADGDGRRRVPEPDRLGSRKIAANGWRGTRKTCQLGPEVRSACGAGSLPCHLATGHTPQFRECLAEPLFASWGWTPVQWVRRPCIPGKRQRPFAPHPSQLRHITNMVHIVNPNPPRDELGEEFSVTPRAGTAPRPFP